MLIEGNVARVRSADGISVSADRPALIRRALDLAGALVAQQADNEVRTFFSQEMHEAFREAGFYRLLVPREHGGLDVDLRTYCSVVMALSSGCPSTGWQFNLSASHTPMAIVLFSEQAQRELFAGGEFICAATSAPTATARRQPGGDWRITGTLGYASGAPYSTHVIGHAFPIDDDGEKGPMMCFVAPRDQWQMLDDWNSALGLRGSGSHSVELKDALIPARYVAEGADMVNGMNGGAPRRPAGSGNIWMSARLISQNLICAAAMGVGMLKGALDEYYRLMQSRTTMLPPITPRHENDDFRRWFGAAAGQLNMAEATILSLADQWNERAEAAAAGRAEFARTDDLRLIGAGLEVMNLTWEAMHGLILPTAGTSAALNGQVIQRILRDMAMARSHVISSMADHYRREFSREFAANPNAALWSLAL